MPAAKIVRSGGGDRPGPKRAMSGPATRNANSGTISGPGAIASPVFSADQPHTPCTRGRRTAASRRRRSRTASSRREAPENGAQPEQRRVDERVAVAQAVQRRTAPSVVDGDRERDDGGRRAPPPVLALDEAPVSAAMPTVTSAAPSASGCGTGWPGTRGSRRQPTTSAAMPIGTLTKNTQRQRAGHEQAADDGPDRRGRAAHRRPRAHRALPPLGSLVARMRLSDVGVSSAAPTA